MLVCMAVGKIFSKGALVDFFQKFSRGAKSGKICFYHSKLRKQHFLLKLSNFCPPSDQAVISLGNQRRRRVFREGPKFFKLCPVVLNYVQHIFTRWAKNFLGGESPSSYGPASNTHVCVV